MIGNEYIGSFFNCQYHKERVQAEKWLYVSVWLYQVKQSRSAEQNKLAIQPRGTASTYNNTHTYTFA